MSNIKINYCLMSRNTKTQDHSHADLPIYISLFLRYLKMKHLDPLFNIYVHITV